MSAQKKTVNGDKVIDYLTRRLSERLMQLEKENAFLTVENIELRDELNALQEKVD